MKISVVSRKAINIMVELAIAGSATGKDLSEKYWMATTTIDNLAVALKANGLIKSRKGMHGGYLLGRPAEEISLADIIKAVEVEKVTAQEPGDPEMPTRLEMANLLWESLDELMFDFLGEITLAQVVEEYNYILNNSMRGEEQS